MEGIKCAFYGSLRKDMYNYERFIGIYGKDSMLYIKTMTVYGLQLYDLGYYPAAIRTIDSTKSIVVDLFNVSREVFSSIQNMEINAGYCYDNLRIDGDTYAVFLYSNNKLPTYSEIISGDYYKHSILNNINL